MRAWKVTHERILLLFSLFKIIHFRTILFCRSFELYVILKKSFINITRCEVDVNVCSNTAIFLSSSSICQSWKHFEIYKYTNVHKAYPDLNFFDKMSISKVWFSQIWRWQKILFEKKKKTSESRTHLKITENFVWTEGEKGMRLVNVFVSEVCLFLCFEWQSLCS